MSRANYQSYKKAYREKQKMLNRKGLQMYDTMLTKREFEAIYEATRKDLKAKVAAGKRKVIGNVTQTIVSEQTYEFTQAQGKAMAEYAKATGQKLTQQQIRAGQIDWELLKERREELFESGFSKEQVREYIGQEYFGSE